MNTISHYVTVKQLVEMGIISEYAIRTQLTAGKIPYIKCGKKNLINYERFIEYLEGGNYGKNTKQISS